jgi:hypothetical protein
MASFLFWTNFAHAATPGESALAKAKAVGLARMKVPGTQQDSGLIRDEKLAYTFE